MSEFPPITTTAILELQDDDEIVEGYFAGFNGAPAPDTTRSRGYHHGYANGRVDAGRAEMTAAQEAMARDYLSNHIGRQPS